MGRTDTTYGSLNTADIYRGQELKPAHLFIGILGTTDMSQSPDLFFEQVLTEAESKLPVCLKVSSDETHGAGS